MTSGFANNGTEKRFSYLLKDCLKGVRELAKLRRQVGDALGMRTVYRQS